MSTLHLSHLYSTASLARRIEDTHMNDASGDEDDQGAAAMHGRQYTIGHAFTADDGIETLLQNILQELVDTGLPMDQFMREIEIIGYERAPAPVQEIWHTILNMQWGHLPDFSIETTVVRYNEYIIAKIRLMRCVHRPLLQHQPLQRAPLVILLVLQHPKDRSECEVWIEVVRLLRSELLTARGNCDGSQTDPERESYKTYGVVAVGFQARFYEYNFDARLCEPMRGGSQAYDVGKDDQVMQELLDIIQDAHT